MEQKVQVIASNPSIDSSLDILSKAIVARKLAIIVGRCRVEYEGRSASRLGPGDRIVIVKPDGVVLVHRPTGYSPVNWQPSSDIVRVEKTGDMLVLKSIRDKPREQLTIYFSEIYMVAVLDALEDKADFIEYLDESEIRDYLYGHPEDIEEGFKPLSKEKPVSEGYIDIIGVDKYNRLVVVEVKRVSAGVDAVKQLYRYVEAIRRENPSIEVRGVLIAPSISKDALILLNTLGLEYKQVNLQNIYRKLRKTRLAKQGPRRLWDFVKID